MRGMDDPVKVNKSQKTTGKYLSRCALGFCSLLVLLTLALAVYLASPLPARQVSRLLTSYLRQNFTVESLQTSGRTLYLKGVRLENPPGFPEGSLATADRIAVSPQWSDLLFGRQRLRLISLEGIKINLEKNSAGAWNFGPLQQLLASRKASPAETRIGEFSVKGGAVRVAGQELRGIALQVFNLTSKGSLDSLVDLSFEDAAQHRFVLKGKGRAGADPALDLTLTAPDLSPEGVAALLQLKKPYLFAGGTGSLRVDASFHKGELSAAGNLSFSQLRYLAAGKSSPLSGSLAFAGDYSVSRDAASLRKCLLNLDNLGQAHAAGAVQGVRKERNFVMDLGFSEVDLGTLSGLLPDKTRKDMAFGGRLGCRTLHLAGNATKVTGASGTLQLQDGALTKGGRLLVAGLNGAVGFSRQGEGVHAKGRFSVAGRHGVALVEALDMPFDLTLSPLMKPVRAEIPALSATALGIPCSGRLSYTASGENPVTASLKVPSTRVATLNPLLKRYDLVASSGTAALTLEAAGKSPEQLAATVGLQLADLQGSRGKNSFAVKKGTVNARLRRGGRELLAQGDARLTALVFNGKGGDARFNYKIVNSMAYLEAVEVSAAGAQVNLAHLRAALPLRKKSAAGSRQPVEVAFDGGSVKYRDIEVGSLDGRMLGSLQSDPSAQWLEGTADLAAGRLAWRGKTVAAPKARIAFSRSGAQGELQGKLLGGNLAGTVSGNPLTSGAPLRFDLKVTDAELAAVAPLMPKGAGSNLSEGLIELRCSGAYSRSAGLAGRFDAKGRRIALSGAGGKKLVSGAAFTLAGELAGDQLTVRDAVCSPGPGVVLKVQGKLSRPFSGERTGNLSFKLPETAANSIFDALINLLPPAIQEATLDGTLAADGKLDLQREGKLLEGSLVFKGGRFEIAGQKLAASGINGSFPFSLELSGKKGGKPPSAMPFSRENYPLLLSQLRGANGGGQTITVGKLGFGSLELGTLTVHATAGNGITEISSLKTSLYEGALLGRGFLSLREGLGYRGDLLVNGLSLKQLCSIFPGITGYISGRLDGVLSISGGAHGLAGLSGFTELWAREGGGEKMLVSKEFLQRLAKQKLGGFFFRSDRSYDQAEIKAIMQDGNLAFDTLKIVHTNLFGVRDLNVSIVPAQNRIALDHLFESIGQAATRGKASTTEQAPGESDQAPQAAPASQEFKWGE
jgi:hypothetical protein